METWDAIRARRNVRRFEDRPIPPEDLDQILEAARRTPSSTNQQGWDFVVSPTLVEPSDSALCTMSLTHGGFDNDAATQHAILTRIARRRTAGLGSGS